MGVCFLGGVVTLGDGMFLAASSIDVVEGAGAAGTREQHPFLTEIADRTEPRTALIRVHECGQGYGLTRVLPPVHACSIRLRNRLDITG